MKTVEDIARSPEANVTATIIGPKARAGLEEAQKVIRQVRESPIAVGNKNAEANRKAA